MKFLDRFVNNHNHDAHPAYDHDGDDQPDDHPGQADQAGQADHRDQPAEPPSPPSALTLVAPAILAPVVRAPRLPELNSEVMATLSEGFFLFPIVVGSIQATSARAFLPAATNGVEELQELASQHPGCQFGMLVNSRFCAFKMEGEFGLGQFFKSLAQRARLASDDQDAGDFGTRLLFGGNTAYAIYLSPELERPRHLPDLGIGLSLVREWIPAPGSEFKGSVYRYTTNPPAKIEPLPNFLTQLIFGKGDACQESRKVLEFPSWLPR